MTSRMLWLALASTLGGGCGGGGGEIAAPDYGEYDLATLDAECEGVAGLTGQAILDRRAGGITVTMAYRDDQGAPFDPTTATLALTWPGAPVATCYPPYSAVGVNPSGSRVAIHGLTLEFATADGAFAEAMDATAWLFDQGEFLSPVQLLALRRYGNLDGTWQLPGWLTGDPLMVFTTVLLGADSSSGFGSIGASAEDADDLRAGVFVGRIAVATWPYVP